MNASKQGYEIVALEEGNDNILSHYRRWYNKYGDPVHIPVVDVRDGVAERILAESMTRQTNRSKYINYNQYHVSPLKSKHL